MGKYGRTKRHRMKKQGITRSVEPKNEVCKQHDDCVALRKWMIAKCSKSLMKNTFKLAPFYFQDTGRGLKTKRAMGPGTVIASIPQCLLINPSCVLCSDELGPLIKRWKQDFTCQQLLALFLICELRKGTSSQWYPFIKSLPTDYTMPQYFSSEELGLLLPHISQQARKLVCRAKQAHKQVLSFCLAHWPDASTWASWEAFRWAWCTVGSRSVYMETEACLSEWIEVGRSEENCMALCPYLDLLNHISTANVQAGFNRQNNCYEIVTQDTYHAHDQVFINYGPHDNVTLFLLYGFTLPHNVHNAVCFSTDDLQELKDIYNLTMWEQKVDILRQNKLSRHLSCTLEGVSWNLKTALVILAMDWSQLQEVQKVLAGETLPAALEKTAHLLAQHLINGVLIRHKQFRAEKFSSEQMSPHEHLANRLLVDDINILTAALQDVR